MRRSGLVVLACTAGSFSCVATRDDPEGVETGAAEQEESPLSGSLRSRYRARRAGGQDDHDLIEVLHLNWRGEGPWSASLLGRLVGRLDGSSGGGGSERFSTLIDADDGDRIDARLYHAFADLEPEGDLERWRLGRQRDLGTPEIAWFDGVHVLGRPRGEHDLQLSAYAGVPVHLFESSAGGDVVAGATLEGRPWQGARGRIDFMHLEDETVLTEHENDLFGARLHQALGERATVDAETSALEGELRDGRVAASWLGDDGLFLRAAHYRLFETQRDRALEVDPFFDTLRFLFPYEQTMLALAHEWGGTSLELGADWRRLTEEEDEGAFNRAYDRYHASLALDDVLHDHLTPILLADHWDGDGTEVEGLGLELAYERGEREEIVLGTQRALYKLDVFLLTERVDVRTWYLRWRRRPDPERGPWKGLGLELAYELDEDDDERFHGLRAGVTWRF